MRKAVYKLNLVILESEGRVPAKEMIKQLLQGHEAVAKTVGSIFLVAESGNDKSSLNLLTQRLQAHEKTAWILRSLLAEK